MSNNEKEIVVLFSINQLNKYITLYKKSGSKYINKYVIIAGRPVEYTDIVEDEKLMKFSDSKVITRELKSKLTFITK